MDVSTRVDPSFLVALSQFIGQPDEIEFERRGTGDSTYRLHGQIIGIDALRSRITLKRTRSHAGEIHEMGLHWLITATHPDGVRFINTPVFEANQKFRSTQNLRLVALQRALEQPDYHPPAAAVSSTYIGMIQGKSPNLPHQRYLFTAPEDTRRKLPLYAPSLMAARRFVSLLDLYAPIDDLVFHSIQGEILCPALMEYVAPGVLSCCTKDWPSLCGQLRVLPAPSLKLYFRRMTLGSTRGGHWANLSELEIRSLFNAGLVHREQTPTSALHALDRVPTAALPGVARALGLKVSSRKRDALLALLAPFAGPDLLQRCLPLIRPARDTLIPPAGFSVEAIGNLASALKEASMVMYKWMKKLDEFQADQRLISLLTTA